jgi:hypothetical protein
MQQTGPPTRVEEYHGSSLQESQRKARADALEAAQYGWEVVRTEHGGTTVRVTYQQSGWSKWAEARSKPSSSQPNYPGIAAIVGGAMIVVGTFLPWLTASAVTLGGLGSVSRNGIETPDGVVVAVLGTITALCAVGMVAAPRTVAWLATTVFAVLAGLLGVVDFVDIQERVASMTDISSGVLANVGPGLYLSLLGAGVATVSALAGVPARQPYQHRRRSSPTPPPQTGWR